MASVVELNGRKYDAVTGELLDASEKPRHAAPSKGTAMDFVRPATNGVRQHIVPAVPQTPKHATSRKTDLTRVTPKHVAAHQPQHAQTLMRRAVSKPGASFKKQAKATSHTGALVKQPDLAIVPKQAAVTVDESRLKRAHHVPRSKLVRHFDTLSYARAAAGTPQQPVARTQARPTATLPVSVQAPIHRDTRQISQSAIARPAPRQTSVDIFERALAQANSHRQPYHPVKRKPKKTHGGRAVLSIAASSLAILLIVGFIAYQNASAIQLRLASSRAGISATLPRWKPTGFALGKFAYAPGTVTVNYANPQTNSSFTITQVATKWDSSTLLNNYVNPNAGSTYNTIESAGSTIYTYGNN